MKRLHRALLTLSLGMAMVVACSSTARSAVDAAKLRAAVTMYASFDQTVRADVGGGVLVPSTRFDHPTDKGKYDFEKGINNKIFTVAKQKGIHGGALECVDVLPRRGRIFFPAKGNLAYRSKGWGGAVSLWINTNPNTMLKTSFCDPIQITEKGASNGGLWIDFPNVKPRDLRLGAFRGLAKGEKATPESDPMAPLVRVKNIDFKSGDWHHLVISWRNFDSGKNNATATLFIDGKIIGQLTDRQIAMRWNLDQTGIYFAVNYIGLLDEFALFRRPLDPQEVRYLQEHPGVLSQLKAAGQKRRSQSASKVLKDIESRITALKRPIGSSQEVVKIRAELHELIKSPQGRDVLARALALLTRLIPETGAPPTAPSFPFNATAAKLYQRDYAAWSGLPLEVINRVGMSLELLPPGTFLMGSPEAEPGHGDSPYDETRHPVRLTRPFYLSKFETTVGQFRQFVKKTGYHTDGEKNGGGHAHDALAVWKHRPGTSWTKPGFAGPFKMQDRHPVVHVSHHDARMFCQWLQGNDRSKELPRYDLPTESQWAWACRAGSGSRYWWGQQADSSGKLLNVGDRTLKQVHPRWPRETMPMTDGYAFPAPVGTYRENNFGLCDMLGNVWEFCSTRYGPYPKALAVDPGDLDPKRGFAVRGGGWSNRPNDARCATRNADPPHFCHSNLGFRVALQLPKP